MMVILVKIIWMNNAYGAFGENLWMNNDYDAFGENLWMNDNDGGKNHLDA